MNAACPCQSDCSRCPHCTQAHDLRYDALQSIVDAMNEAIAKGDSVARKQTERDYLDKASEIAALNPWINRKKR